jgi:hypothetical protein
MTAQIKADAPGSLTTFAALLFPVFGMPSDRDRETALSDGWEYEPYEVAPGLCVASARQILTFAETPRWIYHWPGTDAELGCWKYLPPTEYRVRTCVEYRRLGGPKPDDSLIPRLIYTTGYGNRPIGDLYETVRAIGGWLVDIRHWPHSKVREEYDQEKLRRRFRIRYAHLPEMGNVARGTGEIKIADMDAGIERLQEMLTFGKTPLVLLCACGRPESCHRTVVATEMKQRGYRVAELEWQTTPKAERI